MNFNDFKHLMRESYTGVQIVGKGINEFGMSLRGEEIEYGFISQEITKEIKTLNEFLVFTVIFFNERNEKDLIKDKLNIEKAIEWFKNYKPNSIYPDRYTYEDSGMLDGPLNIYLNGELIAWIDGENRSKEQAYLYAKPMKDPKPCSEFIIECDENYKFANGDNIESAAPTPDPKTDKEEVKTDEA